MTDQKAVFMEIFRNWAIEKLRSDELGISLIFIDMDHLGKSSLMTIQRITMSPTSKTRIISSHQ